MSSTDTSGYPLRVLTDAEVDALLGRLNIPLGGELTEPTDLELEALERGWRRREAARQALRDWGLFVAGALAGVLAVCIFLGAWLIWEG